MMGPVGLYTDSTYVGKNYCKCPTPGTMLFISLKEATFKISNPQYMYTTYYHCDVGRLTLSSSHGLCI